MAPLHRDADLCQSNGGGHPEGPEPQRPGLVWSCSTDGLISGFGHNVPAG